MGLASAVRSRDGAYWASWADAASTTQQKDPDLAATILAGLHSEAEGCSQLQTSVQKGWLLWAWSYQHGTLLPQVRVHRGWQQHVSNTVEKVFHTEAVWPSLETDERESFDAVSE